MLFLYSKSNINNQNRTNNINNIDVSDIYIDDELIKKKRNINPIITAIGTTISVEGIKRIGDKILTKSHHHRNYDSKKSNYEEKYQNNAQKSDYEEKYQNNAQKSNYEEKYQNSTQKIISKIASNTSCLSFKYNNVTALSTIDEQSNENSNIEQSNENSNMSIINNNDITYDPSDDHKDDTFYFSVSYNDPLDKNSEYNTHSEEIKSYNISDDNNDITYDLSNDKNNTSDDNNNDKDSISDLKNSRYITQDGVVKSCNTLDKDNDIIHDPLDKDDQDSINSLNSEVYSRYITQDEAVKSYNALDGNNTIHDPLDKDDQDSINSLNSEVYSRYTTKDGVVKSWDHKIDQSNDSTWPKGDWANDKENTHEDGYITPPRNKSQVEIRYSTLNKSEDNNFNDHNTQHNTINSTIQYSNLKFQLNKLNNNHNNVIDTDINTKSQKMERYQYANDQHDNYDRESYDTLPKSTSKYYENNINEHDTNKTDLLNISPCDSLNDTSDLSNMRNRLLLRNDPIRESTQIEFIPQNIVSSKRVNKPNIKQTDKTNEISKIEPLIFIKKSTPIEFIPQNIVSSKRVNKPNIKQTDKTNEIVRINCLSLNISEDYDEINEIKEIVRINCLSLNISEDYDEINENKSNKTDDMSSHLKDLSSISQLSSMESEDMTVKPNQCKALKVPILNLKGIDTNTQSVDQNVEYQNNDHYIANTIKEEKKYQIIENNLINEVSDLETDRSSNNHLNDSLQKTKKKKSYLNNTKSSRIKSKLISHKVQKKNSHQARFNDIQLKNKLDQNKYDLLKTQNQLDHNAYLSDRSKYKNNIGKRKKLTPRYLGVTQSSKRKRVIEKNIPLKSSFRFSNHVNMNSKINTSSKFKTRNQLSSRVGSDPQVNVRNQLSSRTHGNMNLGLSTRGHKTHR